MSGSTKVVAQVRAEEASAYKHAPTGAGLTITKVRTSRTLGGVLVLSLVRAIEL